MSQLNVPIPLRFIRDGLVKLLDFSWFDLCLKTTLVCAYIGIIALAYHTGALSDNFSQLYETRVGAILLTAGAIYSVFLLVVTLVRVLMVAGYRSMLSLADEDLPTVTVIIPAYNEGAEVAKSIDSIARSDYPREKLQIIAIDDGSKDDTWHHMETAARRHPELVCAIRMDKNGGKRQGLRVGFALAAGDVLVTMDSDSVV